MKLEEITQIGEIINVHGIKGELKIFPLTEDQTILARLKTIYIIQEKQAVKYTVIRARQAVNYWLIQLSEITDRTTAQKLKHLGIFVEDAHLSPLGEDEIFVHDLIGAKVYSVENRYLGTITGYINNGIHGVCEVKPEGKKPFLFPVTHEVLKEVIAGEKVVINVLPDLLEIND